MKMASNVPSVQTLALRAMREEPRGIVGHSQRLRREREWLVSSGNLFNMPGNWTDRNVYAFLGPGYLFGYLVKKMLTMRDYVREMLRVLAEQTPPQLSLTQGANGWTLSGDRGHYLGAYGGPRLRRPERFYEPTGSHDPTPLWKTHF